VKYIVGDYVIKDGDGIFGYTVWFGYEMKTSVTFYGIQIVVLHSHWYKRIGKLIR